MRVIFTFIHVQDNYWFTSIWFLKLEIDHVNLLVGGTLQEVNDSLVSNGNVAILQADTLCEFKILSLYCYFEIVMKFFLIRSEILLAQLVCDNDAAIIWRHQCAAFHVVKYNIFFLGCEIVFIINSQAVNVVKIRDVQLVMCARVVETSLLYNWMNFLPFAVAPDLFFLIFVIDEDLIEDDEAVWFLWNYYFVFI